MRLVLVQGEERVVRWTGFTLDGFSPEGLRGGGRVTVTATDWLGWASGVDMPPSQWEAWLTSIGPRGWWQGYSEQVRIGYYDTLGTSPLYNQASVINGLGADMYGDAAWPDAMDQTATSIATGVSSPAIFFAITAPAGGVAMIVPDAFATSPDWLCGAWVDASTVDSVIWGGNNWLVTIDATGQLFASINMNGFTETTTLTFNHTDDDPHL